MGEAQGRDSSRHRIWYGLACEPDFRRLVQDELPTGYELVFPPDNSAAALQATIAGCDVAIHVASYLSSEVIEAGDDLRLVIHQGVGYQDTVDVEALRRRGIKLALTPEGTSDSVAEHTLLLTMAVQRHLLIADRELRAGRFLSHALRARSCDLVGKTIGYVGMGRIAKGAARRFRSFGTRGLYTNASGPDPRLDPELGLEWVALDELLARADVVSLHAPLTDATRAMIDAEALAKMPAGAILINTARGALVDEEALVEALTSGRLAGAGLDAFAEEPLPPSHPLCALPNVVLTPHCGAGTADALRRKATAMFANIAHFHAGLGLSDEVMLG